MQNSEQVLDMTPIGMIFKVVKTAAQTKGSSLEMEWDLLPKTGGTPVHIHPSARETYKVLEGALDVYMGSKWHTLAAGEELTIPEGTPHTFRNTSDKVVRVYNTHAPAMHFAEYFDGLNRIVQKLSGGGTKKMTMNLTAATYLSVLMKKYDREVVSVNPPRLVVAFLNGLGKLRGLKV